MNLKKEPPQKKLKNRPRYNFFSHVIINNQKSVILSHFFLIYRSDRNTEKCDLEAKIKQKKNKHWKNQENSLQGKTKEVQTNNENKNNQIKKTVTKYVHMCT